MVPRTIILNPSKIPLINNAANEIQNILDNAKTMIQTPKPATASNNFFPCFCVTGNNVIKMIISIAPISVAALSHPKPIGPTFNISLANTGTIATAPPKRTANKSNESAPNNSFVFNEQGIEFAIFKDGQFDFNVLRQRQNFIQYSNHNGINISFNTGYDYSAYVQYDNYGAVIQIENTPVYYDYYGRINQAGNVHVNYDYRGRVAWIGNMRINYDRYNNSRCNGYVNRQHRYYTPSKWNSYYSIPNVQYCVIFKIPYRRYYTPIRYHYKRPYRNNRRPIVYRNRQGQNRVANSRSNHSDRYKTKRDTRKSINNTTNTNNRY